jgi:hypothetical protein
MAQEDYILTNTCPAPLSGGPWEYSGMRMEFHEGPVRVRDRALRCVMLKSARAGVCYNVREHGGDSIACPHLATSIMKKAHAINILSNMNCYSLSMNHQAPCIHTV